MTKQTFPDFDVTIAVGASRLSNEFPARTISWNDFAAYATCHRRTAVTAAQYAAMTGAERSAVKDVGGFVGGVFRDDKRALGNLLRRTMVTLDLDNGHYDPHQLFRHIHDTLGAPAMAGYSTHSHTADVPRIRVCIPLAEPVSQQRYTEIADHVVAVCGLADFTDECSSRPAQLFYWPAAPSDAPVWAEVATGGPYTPPEPAPEPAPVAPRPDVPERERKRPPRHVSLWQKAFNQAYSPIQRAIDTYLQGVYIAAVRGRYKHVGADSEPGLIIGEDGATAYSFHTNTDPAADGHSHDAYSLVAIHRCQGDDKAMRELCKRDKTVYQIYRELKAQAREEARQNSPAAILGLDCNADGRPYPSAANALAIIENDPDLAPNIAYNLMSCRTVARKGLPWFDETHPDAETEHNWTDADDAHLISFISRKYRFDADAKVRNAVMTARSRNRFHPIRDYLDSLSWDGQPRLDTMIIDHLGAEDSPCTRQMTELLMVGAVARVFCPGVKFDYLTVLQGKQGTFKSTLCRVLFSPWYSDSIDIADGKDALQMLRGNWGVELGELAGLRRAEINQVKDFITRQHDEYREAYARTPEQYERQCVFVGTTNDDYFLSDEQNRRFSIIHIDASRRRYPNPSDSLTEVKDQLWAEAVDRYRNVWEGKPLVLSEANRIEQEARNQSAHLTRIDPLRADLEDYLSRPLPSNWETLNPDQRYSYYHTNTHSVAEMKGWPERKTFSVRAFLREYYGYSSEAEARSRNRALGGNLGRKIAEYLREFGTWSEPVRACTIYGRIRQYERISNTPYAETRALLTTPPPLFDDVTELPF